MITPEQIEEYMNPKPSDFIKCSYNFRHFILPDDYYRHLKMCRKKWLNDMINANLIIEVFPCKWSQRTLDVHYTLYPEMHDHADCCSKNPKRRTDHSSDYKGLVSTVDLEKTEYVFNGHKYGFYEGILRSRAAVLKTRGHKIGTRPFF